MILIATLVLAAVFGVAGTAKLRDRAGTRESVRAFGVPAAASAPVALLLPAVELALAAALLIPPSARMAAGAAAVLLLAFTAAVAVALARGLRPSCGCFGGSHAAPIGRGTLGRNAALVGLAGLVAAAPPLPGDRHATIVTAAAVAFAGQTVLLAIVLRRYGHSLRRLDELEAGVELGPDLITELEVGAPAPPFALEATDGRRVTLGDLLAAGDPVLLVFTATGCGACSRLLPDVARWQELQAGRLTVALVAHGDERVLAAEAAEHAIGNVLVAPDRSVPDAYGVVMTPSAVLVDAHGQVAMPVLQGSEIETLFEPERVEPEREVAHA
jgi:peroxiredoxin/uncharacterized membrane protein YphA (DoxX/SURF4 family)